MRGYPKFKGVLVERGIKQKELALLLGISPTSFNSKINGVSDFKAQEVKKICAILKISSDIFFGEFVPQKELNKKEKTQ